MVSFFFITYPLVVEAMSCVAETPDEIDFGVFYLNQSLPFGGTKSSGNGRFAGPEGLRGLCNIKAVTEDRLHGYLQTGIPPLLAYPINSGEAAWTFVSGLVSMVYAPTWRGRGKGLWDLVMAKE